MPDWKRTFPIQGHGYGPEDERTPPGSIPWSVAEVVYGEYEAQYGTGQSLERMAERGGFDWNEVISLLQAAGARRAIRHYTGQTGLEINERRLLGRLVPDGFIGKESRV